MEAIAWAWANPMYAFAGLVGLVVGIFYGFDGWRGDTAAIDFKDSPRWKNLAFVLGGGFAAFFGDLKALDPGANKLLVLVAYFSLFVIAGFAVVMFWGIAIGIARLWAGFKGRSGGYGFLDAITDYFFYGFRHYRQRVDAAGQNAAQVAATQNDTSLFYMAYSQQLSRGVQAAGSVTDASKKNETARAILASVSAVIRSYHRDDANKNGIRANLMLRRVCDDPLRQRLMFVGSTRAQVTRCLELVAYDEIEDEPGIVLPLPDAAQGALAKALPGAPTAFLHPNRYAIIDDTAQIQYQPLVPQDVQAEIRAYLDVKPFRSFGCIQIVGAGVILGVVTVEARMTEVFGRSEEEKRKIISLLLPFCGALAIVFANP